MANIGSTESFLTKLRDLFEEYEAILYTEDQLESSYIIPTNLIIELYGDEQIKIEAPIDSDIISDLIIEEE